MTHEVTQRASLRRTGRAPPRSLRWAGADIPPTRDQRLWSVARHCVRMEVPATEGARRPRCSRPHSPAPRHRGRPVPEPGPGQVLVQVEASGLCHTDIHAAHGDWPVKPTPPFVPGHEGVGIVERRRRRRRTACTRATASPCRGSAGRAARASTASSGWETLCPQQRNTGYSRRRRLRRVRRRRRRASSAASPTASTRSTPRR